MADGDIQRLDATQLPPSKLTRTKLRWAEQGRFLTGQTRPDGSKRLPPGQHVVRDWPVLDLGLEPDVSMQEWRLQIDGAVERPLTLDWSTFSALPSREFDSDIHCVTSWSRFDNRWQGVAASELLAQVGPLASAAFVMLHGADGYTTNVPLADFAAGDTVVACAWQGQPLSVEHGGPVRVVIPQLFFWKSAKWLRRIELLDHDQPGYWEQRGYHMRGDPWAQQRYDDE